MPSDYANDLMARVGLDTTEWKKGITDLNAGIKHIETGFQATAALMDDWGNSSDGLKKRIETLNDKLALQKKKLDTLKTAYEEEVAANGASSKAAEELAKKMYAAKNDIDRTEASLSSYTKKLEDMAVISDKTAQKLDGFASKTRGLSLAATGALAAIGTGLVKAGQNADELNTLAKQTGLTTEEIQKFQYASDLIDVELEAMTGALRKMTKNMTSTSSEVKAAWDTLGVSTTKATGEAKGITETFYELLEALSEVENETERDQLAMQIFGKSANDLAGIVDDGGAALRELGDEAEKLGLIMSQDAVDGANEFNDVIDKLKANVTAELAKAFSENSAELTETAQTVADGLVKVIKAISSLPPGVTKAGIAITSFAAILSPLLTVSSKTVSTMVKLRNAYKSKTAATIESTAAEAAHSKALDKTAVSAVGASKGVKGVGSAAKSANPWIIAVAIALAGIYAYINKIRSGIEESVEQEYNAKISASNKAYDTTITNLGKELEAYKKSRSNLTEETDKFYDDEIAKLEDNLKTKKEAIKTEQELLENAHKERINQLEEERNLKLEIINIREEKAVTDLQEKIDALDALTAAEEKAEKEREDAKKLAELQEAINSAKTYAEKVEAQNEYNEFLRELEQEKVLNARETQKQELQNQIETIKKESEKKREQVNNEYESFKTLEDDKFSYAQEQLDARLDALDSYIVDETDKLEKARAEKLAILEAETDDYVAELQKRIDMENELKEATEKRLEAEKQEEKERQTSWRVMLDANEFREARGHEYEDGKYGYTFWDSVWARLIGANASGTDYWRGGLTRVNEEGGEILNLPRGTQIIPHDVSMEMARAAGQASVTNNSTTNNTNNSYNYGAQQQVTVLKIGDRTVAKVITPQVSVGLSDTIYRRRRSGGAR